MMITEPPNNDGNNDAGDFVMDMDMSAPTVNDDSASASQQNPLSLKVTPKHKTVGVDSAVTSNQVVATVTARDLPSDDQRAAVDIVVALDVSGSMRGSKLQLCKRTLGLLLRTLGAGDRFALVTYASDVRVDIPVREMNEANKKTAIAAIEGLTTRGCTNISAAIGMAFQEMRQIRAPNKVQTIFLLTDGIANEGICDDDGLVELSRNCLIPGGRKYSSGGSGFLGKYSRPRNRATTTLLLNNTTAATAPTLSPCTRLGTGATTAPSCWRSLRPLRLEDCTTSSMTIPQSARPLETP